MKVEIKFSGKAYDPGDEYQEYCNVYVDKKRVANGSNMAFDSEDANLGRDLAFVYDIPALLRAAHEAGRRGEEFVLKETENAI